jgi:hypothetical protein
MLNAPSELLSMSEDFLKSYPVASLVTGGENLIIEGNASRYVYWATPPVISVTHRSCSLQPDFEINEASESIGAGPRNRSGISRVWRAGRMKVSR